MARYVLVPDTTLSREYSNFPLLDFLPCAPSRLVPRRLYEFMKGKPQPAVDGRAAFAPYALRKLEAALLLEHNPDEVAIPHEDYIEEFVDEGTEVIGVYTMDPLGLGPLTMSYSLLLGDPSKPWVRVEFEELVARLNRARAGTRAKLVVGGPGVWELTVMPWLLDELKIDFAFQGEADDIINELVDEIASGEVAGSGYFHGFQSFDADFRKRWIGHASFLTRGRTSKQFPLVGEIPSIRSPTVKGLVEVMRGCGIGCDFCEVTLRPLRYYTPEMVTREVTVNARAGSHNAWLHSDEIFAYQHGPHFEPNDEAIVELFRAAMSVDGIASSNPTHGRVSIPAAHPDLVRRISAVVGAGPGRWVGVQMGLETGSDRLAQLHMPNKTLPLKVGPDGGWQQIVLAGLSNLNSAYWRPAFTVQVGQLEETDEDNWETVAMINRMSASTFNGMRSEFTVTPMQNVPLGIIKNRRLSSEHLSLSQLAVYYACYRHLAKITLRDAPRDSKGTFTRKMLLSSTLQVGSYGLFRVIESICRKRGVDLERAKSHGLELPLRHQLVAS